MGHAKTRNRVYSGVCCSLKLVLALLILLWAGLGRIGWGQSRAIEYTVFQARLAPSKRYQVARRSLVLCKYLTSTRCKSLKQWNQIMIHCASFQISKEKKVKLYELIFITCVMVTFLANDLGIRQGHPSSRAYHIFVSPEICSEKRLYDHSFRICSMYHSEPSIVPCSIIIPPPNFQKNVRNSRNIQ